MKLHDILEFHSNISNFKAYEIQWALQEDESFRPKYIFARNKHEALGKLSERMKRYKSFGNIQIESVKEINWSDIKEKK